MQEMLAYIGVGCLSGAVSGVVTITTLKTDVAWIKDRLKHIDKRVYQLETSHGNH